MEYQVNFFYKIILATFLILNLTHAEPQFLTISDIHYGSAPISKDGQDTGPEFFKISMDKFRQLSTKADFILFLGDIPVHSLFIKIKKEQFEQIVFHALFQNDIQAKPMFYIAGNNDSLNGNYQPFESNGLSPLNFANDWNGACVHCKGLIINDSHMRHGGYYSSYVMPKNKEIILIALNATQWAKTPFFSHYPSQEKDALEQLAWLETQLKTHQAKQLLIAMHEPPGKSFRNEPILYKEYEQKFIDLLAKYSPQYGQISLLTSHTHMEEFRKIKLANENNIYAFSTPGISRNHHNYPGMKLFSFNKKLQLQNFTTYYTSELHQWNDQKYNALSGTDPIFPNCQNKTLAQCLNALSTNEVCNDLDRGLFYGVKNPRVLDISCRNTYNIN